MCGPTAAPGGCRRCRSGGVASCGSESRWCRRGPDRSCSCPSTGARRSPCTTASARRSRLPIASVAPSSSVRVVCPMMQTAAPDRSSLSENQRPSASFQLPDSKYSLVVPVIVVDRFLAPLMTLRPSARHRRDGGDRRHVAAQRVHVLTPERLRAPGGPARAHALPRHHAQHVAAHVGDVGGDLGGGTVAERHHDDHRRHADDDPERRQRRAQDVATDFAQRQHDGVESISDVPPVRSSLSTWPSRKRIVRAA